MVRQARSEATRRKIITSAVELFNEIGYPATGLGDIIERAEMTKGALYYHFDSKESLATAIIEEGSANLIHAFRSITESSAPTLESMIHGAFVAADLLSTDKVARSGTQLLRAFGEFNDAAARTYEGWLIEMAARARQAIDEGDLRADLDPESGRRNHRRHDARRGTAVERHVGRSRHAGTSRPNLEDLAARHRQRRVASLLPRVLGARGHAARIGVDDRVVAYSSSTHSRSVRSWNVASATGSSPRNKADLLILARTIELVVVHQLDDQIRVGAHNRDGGFVGRQGVEDLPELQRLDRLGGVAEHLGERRIGEEDRRRPRRWRARGPETVPAPPARAAP